LVRRPSVLVLGGSHARLLNLCEPAGPVNSKTPVAPSRDALRAAQRGMDT
jgi:hypothetical protein